MPGVRARPPPGALVICRGCGGSAREDDPLLGRGAGRMWHHACAGAEADRARELRALLEEAICGLRCAYGGLHNAPQLRALADRLEGRL